MNKIVAACAFIALGVVVFTFLIGPDDSLREAGGSVMEAMVQEQKNHMLP